jgi:hypothetical protein
MLSDVSLPSQDAHVCTAVAPWLHRYSFQCYTRVPKAGQEPGSQVLPAAMASRHEEYQVGLDAMYSIIIKNWMHLPCVNISRSRSTTANKGSTGSHGSCMAGVLTITTCGSCAQCSTLSSGAMGVHLLPVKALFMHAHILIVCCALAFTVPLAD